MGESSRQREKGSAGSAWVWVEEKWRSFVRAVGGSSLAGTLVVGGSAALGGALALFPNDIRRSLLQLWRAVTDQDTTSALWPAIFFCVSFLLVVIIAWFKEFARAAEARELRQELNEQIDDLREITRTMPPRDYLERYGEQSRKVSFEAQTVIPGITQAMERGEDLEEWRDTINNAVRVVLDAILNLAMVFDAPHDSRRPVYWASIFWIKTPNDVDHGSRDAVWEHAWELSRHEDAGSFFSRSEVLLVRDVNLSTSRFTVDQKDPEPSPLLPLVLGWEEAEVPEARNLPGLALALDRSRYSWISDTRMAMPQLTEFGLSARERVGSFFSTNLEYRSLMSMRLEGVSSKDAEMMDVAVLTLHRDSPGIMRSLERADMFYHQLAPLLPRLFELCYARQALDANATGDLTVYTELTPVPSTKEDSDAETE